MRARLLRRVACQARPIGARCELARREADVTEPTEVPRLALSVGEACQALGISWDLWHHHVEHEVRVIRLGRRKLIAVAELERWLEEHGERVLEQGHGRGVGRG